MRMESIKHENYKNKELIVRKKVAGLVEKVLKYFGKEIRHNTYKSIVYGECAAKEINEKEIKNYYDAYMYLLHNSENPLTQELLEKFFFIFNTKMPEKAIVIKLSSFAFHKREEPLIDQLADMSVYAYKELRNYDELERILATLMMFNYLLVKGGIPMIAFTKENIKKYISVTESEDSAKLKAFIIDLINKSKYQELSYYKNLKYLDAFDIQNIIINDKNNLVANYGINHVYLYGSFSSGIQRIDSDIDLLCEFSEKLTYPEKRRSVEYLTEHYFKVFNRFVDIQEVSEYINEAFLKEVTRYIKIY